MQLAAGVNRFFPGVSRRGATFSVKAAHLRRGWVEPMSEKIRRVPLYR